MQPLRQHMHATLLSELRHGAVSSRTMMGSIGIIASMGSGSSSTSTSGTLAASLSTFAASASPSSAAATAAAGPTGRTLSHAAFHTTTSSSSSSSSSTASHTPIQWVFLGAPGVGKGTYASRAAKHFQVAHIATGDLIRAEIKAGSDLGKRISGLVQQGALVPDELIMDLLDQRLDQGRSQGEKGFILDGFPRTRVQAEKLLGSYQLQVAFNLTLREEVLIEKCLGRRTCKHCGKGYNIADIYLPADATTGKPAIIMPPLPAPPECINHLETREDDTEAVVRRRLEAYRSQSGPVEDFFRTKGLLSDFEITAGIPETLPTLLNTLSRYVPGVNK